MNKQILTLLVEIVPWHYGKLNGLNLNLKKLIFILDCEIIGHATGGDRITTTLAREWQQQRSFC